MFFFIWRIEKVAFTSDSKLYKAEDDREETAIPIHTPLP